MVSIYICVPCRVHLAAAVPTIWPGTRHPTRGYRQKGTEESRVAGVGVHNSCKSQVRIVCSVRVFGLLRCDSHCYGMAWHDTRRCGAEWIPKLCWRAWPKKRMRTTTRPVTCPTQAMWLKPS
ncbi:hypothetical protein CH063_08529 [Colletotrichum higginsianum]|uniref:Uncharacterized protein n=1 Tax=Colletotrichum higginsianum (strain IMI 349063) TaxID=759273 RepID=H1VA59_COLHI|nr:hypothetical protein CH063_08529 [Colletotrichum higginsianum]